MRWKTSVPTDFTLNSYRLFSCSFVVTVLKAGDVVFRVITEGVLPARRITNAEPLYRRR